MNIRRFASHPRIALLAVAMLSVVAWAATQRNRVTVPDPSTTIGAPELAEGFAAEKPSKARRNRVFHGDADAVTAFATITPSGAMTALPASGDPIKGTFSPVFDWPLVGLHMVLTPDGRVLTYGTSDQGTRTGYYLYDVWDPQLGLGSNAHTSLPNNTAVDIFCNAQLLMPNGNIEMWGGDIVDLTARRATLVGNDDSTVFNTLDNSLTRTGKMNRKRWYATATMLSNGEVYIQGGNGGKDYPEVRNATGEFRLLTGASTDYLPALYPRNFFAPDGQVFGVHYNQMYRVNPSGPGTLARVGKFTSTNVGSTSTSVMFQPGKILQVGGGTDAALASAEAHVIDINPYNPVVTAAARPAYRRQWANATVLPNGRVFLSGGSTADNDPVNGVAYTSELYNPVANAWSTGATAQQMRLYHSAQLLLPDATVLTLGGGAPGPQLNLNGEIYYPPYLFKADGTPAPRPIIASLPMTTDPARKIRIGTPVPSNISRVTLIKTGSNTHSIDMDQRFMELPFSIVGGELEATLPSNKFLTPPGFYMVFVINQQGVPSEAAMLRINVPPAPGATLTVIKRVINDDGGNKVASDFGFSLNGAAPTAFEADGSNELTVPAGTYTVTEPATAGYTASLSGCSGLTLAVGDRATCTITNDDQIAQPATLTVTQTVINDNGGSNVAADFSFVVNGGAPIAFQADGSNVLSLPAGSYTITQPAVTGYSTSLAGCSGVVLAAGGSARCAITSDDVDNQVGGGNLIVNGSFETNTVPDGSGQLLASLSGWSNKANPIEIWRNNFGYTPGAGSSYLEVDGIGGVANRIYQDIPTVAGATYELSFLHSPRPGNSAESNRFDVYWNETTRVYKMWTDDATGLTDTRWRRVTVLVTGTGGNDRLSFREADADDRGVLIDDVKLTRK